MANKLYEEAAIADAADAIREKNGSTDTYKVSELGDAIRAIPTGDEFDMIVTDDQYKMVIEVADEDKSFWTRFGRSAQDSTTVTAFIDWGDGTSDTFTETSILEYATQRKHLYQKAGRYLVTVTVQEGVAAIGTINTYCILSEGDISPNYRNTNIIQRWPYLLKLKEASFGKNIYIDGGLRKIPSIRLHNDVNFNVQNTGVSEGIQIKNGISTIGSYWFAGTVTPYVKIPASVTTINSNAFDDTAARILDFTDIQLDESGNLPITISATNVFRGSALIVFDNSEIAEVAKVATNWSVYASKITYVGGY